MSILKKIAELTLMYRYDMYIPLHALWTEYVTDLLGNTSPDSAVLNKLIRADFHGALLTGGFYLWPYL